MDTDATLPAQTPRKARLRGRPRVRGKLAERVGQELQRSRIKRGLDLSAGAGVAEVSTKRLAEIEEGAVTTTISTVERIAEKVGLDWSTVFVARPDAEDADSSATQSEAGHGA